MNKLEVAYAEHLMLLQHAGEIVDWKYERVTLKLADDTRYTPDFWVLNREYEQEFHETKGRWMEDARVKIKVAAEQFPYFRFVGVQRPKGATEGWVFEEFHAA